MTPPLLDPDDGFSFWRHVTPTPNVLSWDPRLQAQLHRGIAKAIDDLLAMAPEFARELRVTVEIDPNRAIVRLQGLMPS